MGTLEARTYQLIKDKQGRCLVLDNVVEVLLGEVVLESAGTSDDCSSK